MIRNARILILGSGGREHAFSWSLVNDENVDKVYCAPGNGGTDEIAENIDIDVSNHEMVIDFVKSKKIDLTIVGPEVPLADGIVDSFQKLGLSIFGPDKYASQLESSKLFARDMMAAYNIPSPKYYSCKNRIEVDLVKVKLEVYNINDKLLNTLYSAFKSAGNHTIEWNAKGLPSGVYFVKLDAGDFTQTQKLMLIK